MKFHDAFICDDTTVEWHCFRGFSVIA